MPWPGLLGFPPLEVGRGEREEVSADWLSGGEKRRELGDLKGQGNAPWPASGRENEEGEAEFGRRKGVWQDQDFSWEPPTRLRRRVGETDSYPKRLLTGLGLGAKGQGDTVFFFS